MVSQSSEKWKIQYFHPQRLTGMYTSVFCQKHLQVCLHVMTGIGEMGIHANLPAQDKVALIPSTIECNIKINCNKKLLQTDRILLGIIWIQSTNHCDHGFHRHHYSNRHLLHQRSQIQFHTCHNFHRHRHLTGNFHCPGRQKSSTNCDAFSYGNQNNIAPCHCQVM